MKLKFQVASLVFLLLPLAAPWAQNSPPRASSELSRNAAPGMAAAPAWARTMNAGARGQQRPQSAFQDRLQDMQDTVAKMHAVLMQMQAKAAKSKDQSVIDNVRMWELMLNHLDKTLAQARMSVAQRSMYQGPMAGRNMQGAVQLPTPPAVAPK